MTNGFELSLYFLLPALKSNVTSFFCPHVEGHHAGIGRAHGQAHGTFRASGDAQAPCHVALLLNSDFACRDHTLLPSARFRQTR